MDPHPFINSINRTSKVRFNVSKIKTTRPTTSITTTAEEHTSDDSEKDDTDSEKSSSDDEPSAESSRNDESQIKLDMQALNATAIASTEDLRSSAKRNLETEEIEISYHVEPTDHSNQSESYYQQYKSKLSETPTYNSGDQIQIVDTEGIPVKRSRSILKKSTRDSVSNSFKSQARLDIEKNPSKISSQELGEMTYQNTCSNKERNSNFELANVTETAGEEAVVLESQKSVQEPADPANSETTEVSQQTSAVSIENSALNAEKPTISIEKIKSMDVDKLNPIKPFHANAQPDVKKKEPPRIPKDVKIDSSPELKGVSKEGRYVKYQETIGRGSYKTVYKGLDTENSSYIAWNELHELKQNKDEKKRFKEEASMLKDLSHKNLIRFHNFFEYTPNGQQRKVFVLITELMNSGTLKNYIAKKYQGKTLPLTVIKSWSKQILEGLHYLHNRKSPIAHRDLKCDNIFIIGSSGEVKIGDLGLAKTMSQDPNANKSKSLKGTPEFMAPEVFAENYSHMCDIWSFGLCLLEIATNDYPYNECENSYEIYKKVKEGGKPDSLKTLKDKDVPGYDAIYDIINKCLEKEAENRPTTSDLLKESFFREDINVTHINLKRKFPILSQGGNVMEEPIYSFQLKFDKVHQEKSREVKAFIDKHNVTVEFNIKKDDIKQKTEEIMQSEMDTDHHIIDDDDSNTPDNEAKKKVFHKRDRKNIQKALEIAIQDAEEKEVKEQIKLEELEMLQENEMLQETSNQPVLNTQVSVAESSTLDTRNLPTPDVNSVMMSSTNTLGPMPIDQPNPTLTMSASSNFNEPAGTSLNQQNSESETDETTLSQNTKTEKINNLATINEIDNNAGNLAEANYLPNENIMVNSEQVNTTPTIDKTPAYEYKAPTAEENLQVIEENATLVTDSVNLQANQTDNSNVAPTQQTLLQNQIPQNQPEILATTQTPNLDPNLPRSNPQPDLDSTLTPSNPQPLATPAYTNNQLSLDNMSTSVNSSINNNSPLNTFSIPNSNSNNNTINSSSSIWQGGNDASTISASTNNNNPLQPISDANETQPTEPSPTNPVLNLRETVRSESPNPINLVQNSYLDTFQNDGGTPNNDSPSLVDNSNSNSIFFGQKTQTPGNHENHAQCSKSKKSAH